MQIDIISKYINIISKMSTCDRCGNASDEMKDISSLSIIELFMIVYYYGPDAYTYVKICKECCMGRVNKKNN
jgi:hypothetical protein